MANPLFREVHPSSARAQAFSLSPQLPKQVTGDPLLGHLHEAQQALSVCKGFGGGSFKVQEGVELALGFSWQSFSYYCKLP